MSPEPSRRRGPDLLASLACLGLLVLELVWLAGVGYLLFRFT